MKVIKIGELKDLMQYTNEIKFSENAVMFKGVYFNEALAENTPFGLVRILSELDPKEYTQLMDLTLPNGHKVFEVFAKIRKPKRGEFGKPDFPAKEIMRRTLINEVHCKCKHYGGNSRYCHKLHTIIESICTCGFFEKK